MQCDAASVRLFQEMKMLNRYFVMAMSIVAQFGLAHSLSAQGSDIEEIRITADPLSKVDNHLIQPA